MKVIIAGSTGMIGGLILEECIKSDKIKTIINIIRKPEQSHQHKKVENCIIRDFISYDQKHQIFQNIDAAYFCIGVYTGQVKTKLLKLITVDFAVEFAKILRQNSPNARLCLLSGAGADRTEKSKSSFAKFKGMAENQITNLGLEFYTFRPSYIYPVTPRKEPNFIYSLTRKLYPIIQLFGKNASIKSTELAKAMFLVSIYGTSSEILENKDILKQLKEFESKFYK